MVQISQNCATNTVVGLSKTEIYQKKASTAFCPKHGGCHHEDAWLYFPIQNLEKISSRTSSATSAPQTSPRANVADLKSMVQKSSGS